jgi:hypothetical protein
MARALAIAFWTGGQRDPRRRKLIALEHIDASNKERIDVDPRFITLPTSPPASGETGGRGLCPQKARSPRWSSARSGIGPPGGGHSRATWPRRAKHSRRGRRRPWRGSDGFPNATMHPASINPARNRIHQ